MESEIDSGPVSLLQMDLSHSEIQSSNTPVTFNTKINSSESIFIDTNSNNSNSGFLDQNILCSFLFNLNFNSRDDSSTEKLSVLLTTVYIIVLSTFLATRVLGRRCPKTVRSLCKVVLLNFTLLVLLPPLGFLYCTILLYRGLLSLYFKIWMNGEIKLMDCTDVAWAAESDFQCNHFTSLYILRGKCNLENIQQRILNQLVNKRDEKTGQLIYERIQYCVKKKFGFYCWTKHQKFDVTKHVRLINEERCHELEFRESDIFHEIEKFADSPMDPSLPQWQILVAPKFTYDDEKMMMMNGKKMDHHYAIIFRIHHSIMDGVSAGHALKHALADTPIKFSVDPLKPLKVSLFNKILVYCHAILFGATEAFNSMTLADRNCFHKTTLTGPKKFGWSRPIRLDTLKTIKQRTGTTTTAVLMSSIGGSIKRLATKKNFEIPRRIHGATTVALLPYPDIYPRNRFVLVHFPLEIGLGSSTERLESAHETAVRLSSSSNALVNYTLTKIGGRLPALFADFIMGLLSATIILSNVPGPSESAFLFGGHLLTDGVFWIPLKNWTGLGACLFSYNGRVRATFVGDKSSVPDELDVSNLIKGFEDEILQLAKTSGVDMESVFWSPSRDD